MRILVDVLWFLLLPIFILEEYLTRSEKEDMVLEEPQPISAVEPEEEEDCKSFIPTQEMVDESLNNAIENGYEELLTWSDEDIEADLIAYNYEDFGCAKLGSLVPLIKIWRENNS